MNYQSEIITRIKQVKNELHSLELSLDWEKRQFVHSKVNEGWSEVHIEEQEDWGSVRKESWFLFSPNVSKELVEIAKGDRYFKPSNEDISNEDYFDLSS